MYPVLLVIGGFELRSSYLFLFLGVLAGILVSRKEAQRVGISLSDFHLYLILAIPLALFLAALNSSLFVSLTRRISMDLDYVFSYGLVSYGAVIGALLVGYIVAKIRNLVVGLELDTISVILPLVLSIYRIGCLLNGCCYGLETDGFLGLVLPGGGGVWAWRYPTQIWLMVFNLALFIWLWRSRVNKGFDGILTLRFLIAYSAGRIIIDAFRELPRVLGPFSPHQLMGIIVLLTTLYAYYEIRRSRRKNPD